MRQLSVKPANTAIQAGSDSSNVSTILGHFVTSVERARERPLFRTRNRTISYADAALRIHAAAVELQRAGLRPGDKIVCFEDQTITLVLFMLAAGFARVIPVPLSPLFSKGYLNDLVDQCGARGVLVGVSELNRCAKLRVAVFCHIDESNTPPPDPRVRVILSLHGGADVFDEATHTSGPFIEALPRLRSLAEEVSADDAFVIQPTSGSSGTPKFVLRKHAAFARYAKFVGDEVAVGISKPNPKVLAVNALTHAFAGHMLTMALRFAGELVIPRGLDSNASLEEVRELDPDILPMTPRVLRSFVRQQEAKQEAPNTSLFGPNAKLLLSAGGRGDSEAFRRLRSEGVEVVEFYGSSEASVVAVTPYGRWRPGVAGVMVEDVSHKLSRSGELLVKSPGLMLGYHGDEDLTNLVFDDDEYYRTGDMAAVGPDSSLEIVGRKRDLFNTPEGTNIYPERIEIRLEALPWVDQAIIVGDGQPYIIAFLAVRDRHPNAWLTPREHPEQYRQAGIALEKLNGDLEVVERIVAFALRGSPFDTSVYSVVTAGKVRRNRPRFLDENQRLIARLYSHKLDKKSLMLVPPRERRFTSRARRHSGQSS